MAKWPVAILCACALLPTAAVSEPLAPQFNRAPLAQKSYAELPLGAIRPDAWLRDELERMAGGMTGNLDAWYPEVCGPRNAWLGGDGDTWERGPYWIDGLYPLARLLESKPLQEKAQRWIDWTIENQHADGYIGPVELSDADRTQPPPRGAQIEEPDDWWPRMVMMKILQQHIMATGDPRAQDCLLQYCRYQLKTLPAAPLHDPGNPRSGSWWAAQRGGDNLMVVLWLYNVTGEEWLLQLANILHDQTVPVTDWFLPGPKNVVRYASDQSRDALHCVNLAQMMKTPVVRWQQDQDPRHLEAVSSALRDIRDFHGQPHGLYGGDEGMHGRGLARGSELCSAVEMMFSLETMLEVTGDTRLADHLERIAYNALPTQCTDDHRARQYFQQSNQVLISKGDRSFFNDGGERQVYGLLNGYPCCTCNLHQGWPKFVQHLWMATSDHGLAALAYGPSTVTAQVAGGKQVTLRQSGGYPFKEEVIIEVVDASGAEFPLHLRIPGWCRGAEVHVNGDPIGRALRPGTVEKLRREWQAGDKVTLRLPMPLRESRWVSRSVAIERGPLVFALDVASQEQEVERPRPQGVPESAMHRGYIEHHPTAAWNYGLPDYVLRNLADQTKLESDSAIPANPWSSETTPVRLTTRGVLLPGWPLVQGSAAEPALSPVAASRDAELAAIRLIPYGATTLRVSAFPVVRGAPVEQRAGEATLSASHVFEGDSLAAIQDGSTQASPRHTFWPHTGREEWLQVTFDQPQEVSRATVDWFDDTGHGRTPNAWELLYRKDGKWTPVRMSGPYSTDPKRSNTAEFEPVTTTAIRMKVKLRKGFSAGVREWRLN